MVASAPVIIYSLSTPTEGVRYVGKTIQPRERLIQHLSAARTGRRSPLHIWLKGLEEQGVRPKMDVLEYCTSENWQERERHWIAKFRESGNLLNVAPGGVQPSQPVDAFHRHVWTLKKRMSTLLSRGYVREDTKAKLRLAAQKRPDLFGEYASL